MKIKLNGKEKEYQAHLNLKEIIAEYSPSRQRIIAEVNGQIIRNQQWEQTRLNDGDRIELVSFVGGGIIPSLVTRLSALEARSPQNKYHAKCTT